MCKIKLKKKPRRHKAVPLMRDFILNSIPRGLFPDAIKLFIFLNLRKRHVFMFEGNCSWFRNSVYQER